MGGEGTVKNEELGIKLEPILIQILYGNLL
jgi:hypothetical protein